MPKTAPKKTAKTKTLPYDVAAQLRTPEEMAAYLDAWLEEAPDDVAGIARAIDLCLFDTHLAIVAHGLRMSRALRRVVPWGRTLR